LARLCIVLLLVAAVLGGCSTGAPEPAPSAPAPTLSPTTTLVSALPRQVGTEGGYQVFEVTAQQYQLIGQRVHEVIVRQALGPRRPLWRRHQPGQASRADRPRLLQAHRPPDPQPSHRQPLSPTPARPGGMPLATANRQLTSETDHSWLVRRELWDVGRGRVLVVAGYRLVRRAHDGSKQQGTVISRGRR
jgi:hypothetical protein